MVFLPFCELLVKVKTKLDGSGVAWYGCALGSGGGTKQRFQEILEVDNVYR
jgi:hypothetical protein